MANNEPNYFGLKLGEAIAGGAVPIADALQRRYAMQRRDEEMAMAERRRKDELESARGFEMQKLGYDNTPEALEQFIADRKRARGLDDQKDIAQTKLIESQANMYSGMTGVPTTTGPEIVKDAQGREYMVKPGPRGPEFHPVQPKIDKPLSEISVKANLGYDSINKLIDMYSTGEFESPGRKLKASLGGGVMGNVARSGDTKAQQLASYQQQVTQALGRMVSGAVITPSEEKEFRSLLYSPFRDKAVNIENMTALKSFFETALPARIKQKYGEDISIGQPQMESATSEIALSPEKAQRLMELRQKAGR